MGGIDDDIERYGLDDRDGWYGEQDDEPLRETRCRDCLSEDVYWAKGADGRWVLYNFNSRKHVCKSNVVRAIRLDAFDDLEE